MNLAWKLTQTLRGCDPAVLDTYEAERRPFAASLVNTTDRLFSAMTKPTVLARFVKTSLVPTVLPPLMGLNAVSRQFFLATSQIRLRYPDSPLSRGRAGNVRGGDRLPWVELDEGSNFAALQSLTWQVHVYGEPSSAMRAWCKHHGLALHTFPYTPKAARAGLTENALYLVRPDGYVGLAAAHFEPEVFETYAGRWLPGAAPSAGRSAAAPAAD